MDHRDRGRVDRNLSADLKRRAEDQCPPISGNLQHGGRRQHITQGQPPHLPLPPLGDPVLCNSVPAVPRQVSDLLPDRRLAGHHRTVHAGGHQPVQRLAPDDSDIAGDQDPAACDGRLDRLDDAVPDHRVFPGPVVRAQHGPEIHPHHLRDPRDGVLPAQPADHQHGDVPLEGRFLLHGRAASGHICIKNLFHRRRMDQKVPQYDLLRHRVCADDTLPT